MTRSTIKQTGFFLFVLMFLASCNAPTDKAQLEKQLAKLQKEAAEITAQIAKIEAEIASLSDSSDHSLLITVEIQELATASYSTRSEFQATVESDNNTVVSAENGGLVQKIHVKEGQQVTAGQLLISLDASLVQTQIEEINKALELAETVFAKQTRLREQKVGTEMQYLEAKNRYESLVKQKMSAELRKSKFFVKAPFSGKIDAIYTTAGALAGPGSPMLRLVDDGSVKVIAQVPESYVGAFKKGDKVLVNYPGINKQSEEIIDAVGKVINPDNRTFLVFIRPNNKEIMLKPNLLAIVSAVDFEVDSAILVPTSIIKRDADDKPYVFVVEEKDNQQVVVKKSLLISKYGIDKSIVTAGLAIGDKLVVKGFNSVDVGDKVKTVNALSAQ